MPDYKKVEKSLAPSIPAAATLFPMSAIAIVKPILLDRVDRKASMPVPDYQNVETIAAILRE